MPPPGSLHTRLRTAFGKSRRGSTCADVDAVDWSRNLPASTGIAIHVYSDHRQLACAICESIDRTRRKLVVLNRKFYCSRRVARTVKRYFTRSFQHWNGICKSDLTLQWANLESHHLVSISYVNGNRENAALNLEFPSSWKQKGHWKVTTADTWLSRWLTKKQSYDGRHPVSLTSGV